MLQGAPEAPAAAQEESSSPAEEAPAQAQPACPRAGRGAASCEEGASSGSGMAPLDTPLTIYINNYYREGHEAGRAGD